MHKIIFFPEKKTCVPTLPKMLRPVTKTHLFFYLALYDFNLISGFWGCMENSADPDQMAL